MFQKNIDKMIVWGIMESAPLFRLLTEKRLKIVVYNLADDWQFGAFCLQYHLSSFPLAPSPSADLRHHHESMLVRAEIRIIQHAVGIEDAHHTHFIKIQSFTDHLSSNE